MEGEIKALFRIVDFETDGQAPPEEPIELGYTDLIWDSSARVAEIADPVSLFFDTSKPKLNVEAQAVHHLTKADLAGAPVFDAAAARLMLSGEPYALVAHQADFERQWITEEALGQPVRWLDTYKVALRLWQDAPGHGLQLLRYFLNLPVDRAKATPPHRAGPDTYITAYLLAEALQLATVREMDLWTRQPKFFARCPLKKHKGQRWDEVPADYLRWIIGPNDVEEAVKHAAREELHRRADAAQTKGTPE